MGMQTWHVACGMSGNNNDNDHDDNDTTRDVRERWGRRSVDADASKACVYCVAQPCDGMP